MNSSATSHTVVRAQHRHVPKDLIYTFSRFEILKSTSREDGVACVNRVAFVAVPTRVSAKRIANTGNNSI